MLSSYFLLFTNRDRLKMVGLASPERAVAIYSVFYRIAVLLSENLPIIVLSVKSYKR